MLGFSEDISQQSLFEYRCINRGTEAIKQLAADGQLFGDVECTIKADNPLFDEMSPIFKTVDVNLDICDHLRDLITSNMLNTNKRSTLVGAKKAKKILIATPLFR